MAVFCDFENVALGVRDMNYDKFDIKPVLERLLLKGSIVVKKAYCDWDRYKSFKGTMHEANFELIEIPHVRQSGKNSADIRMVVDALDLCYTKAHVDTFVIISGDSDFSPLVSKLRENAKRVIGVGVKQSTSDLLVTNCDEFIFYDDLVREQRRAAAKRDERKAQPQQQGRRPSDDRKREEMEARKLQALEMVVETFDALVSERGDTGKIWASLLKDTLKRRRPDFNESYFGFRTFGNLLEEAQTRGLFEFGRDEKSGTYVYRNLNVQPELQPAEAAGAPIEAEPLLELTAEVVEDVAAETGALPAEAPARESRRRGGRGRKSRDNAAAAIPAADAVAADRSDDAAAPADSIEAVDTAQALDGADAVDAAAATPGDARPARGSSRPTRPARSPRGKRTDYRAEVAPAPTPDLVEPEAEAEAASQAGDALEPPPSAAAAAETAEATGKERRRSPRAPRKTAANKTAKVDDKVAQPVPAAAADTIVADSAPAGQGNEGPASAHDADDAEWADEDDVNGNVAAAPAESTRPARKAPSRKSAPRARRPAKGKTADKG